MKKNQYGLSTVEILIVLGVVSLVGVAGWYMWQKNNTKSADDNKSSVVASQESVKQNDTKTYANDKYGITFDYPASWLLQEQDNNTLVVSLSPGTSLRDKIALTAFVRTGAKFSDVTSNYENLANSKASDFKTSSETGQFFSLSGNKYTHSYIKLDEPTFYTYILDRSDAVLEFRITMSQYDKVKDQEIIDQVEALLAKGTYTKQ